VRKGRRGGIKTQKEVDIFACCNDERAFGSRGAFWASDE
jgi:hypothetical protein